MKQATVSDCRNGIHPSIHSSIHRVCHTTPRHATPCHCSAESCWALHATAHAIGACYTAAGLIRKHPEAICDAIYKLQTAWIPSNYAAQNGNISIIDWFSVSLYIKQNTLLARSLFRSLSIYLYYYLPVSVASVIITSIVLLIKIFNFFVTGLN